MTRRGVPATRRARLTVLAAVVLHAGVASAALQKLEVRNNRLTFVSAGSPTNFNTREVRPNGEPVVTRALIDDSGAAPVSLQMSFGVDGASTIHAPQLSGFIFVRSRYTEGPSADQTGVSGSTQDRIRWGTVTGWQLSGARWCNSEPATLCLLAGGSDESTSEIEAPSPFYDIGSWFFHGTGFTGSPFVWSRFTVGSPGGNAQIIARGSFAPDGSVPVLPLAGIGALFGATLLAGATVLRRH